MNQTLEFTKNNKNIYTKEPFIKKNFWKIMKKLNTIIDESDPDTDLPQIIHAYQTGESIKNIYLDENSQLKKNLLIKNLFNKDEWNNLPIKYKLEYNTYLHEYYNNINDWKWFPLLGFIHDSGKIMLLEEFGKLPQWAVVGDTFPLNCKLSSNYVYYDKQYHKNNSSLMENKNKNKCGFNNLNFSWSHDEYIASFLERNKNNMPEEAIYIVRYHSFYSWHTPRNNIRGYTEYADDHDWKMLPLIKAFQKADLYSKTKDIPSENKIKNIYNQLLNKYFDTLDLLW